MDPSPSSSSQSPSSVAAPAKIFVGGITKELEEVALKEYFQKYGEVKEVVMVKDKATGNAKGYVFIEFVDAEAAERAINEEGPHLIRDRLVEVKRARPRSSGWRLNQSNYHQSSFQSTNKIINDDYITSKKIFVGGLPSNITEDEFRTYFEQFGSVNDAVIMTDSETRRPRGFGFITFDSGTAARNTMQKRFHELNRKAVEVKIAVPKDDRHCNNMNHYASSGWRSLDSYVNHHHCGYLPYGYGLGPFGYEGGGYAYEGYCAIGYGAPYSSPMLPWNEQQAMMMTTIRQVAVPYCDAVFYPGYVNTVPGGYMKMANGGFHGDVWHGKGRLNQTGAHMKMKELGNNGSLELEKARVDGDE